MTQNTEIEFYANEITYEIRDEAFKIGDKYGINEMIDYIYHSLGRLNVSDSYFEEISNKVIDILVNEYKSKKDILGGTLSFAENYQRSEINVDDEYEYEYEDIEHEDEYEDEYNELTLKQKAIVEKIMQTAITFLRPYKSRSGDDTYGARAYPKKAGLPQYSHPYNYQGSINSNEYGKKHGVSEEEALAHVRKNVVKHVLYHNKKYIDDILSMYEDKSTTKNYINEEEKIDDHRWYVWPTDEHGEITGAVPVRIFDFPPSVEEVEEVSTGYPFGVMIERRGTGRLRKYNWGGGWFDTPQEAVAAVAVPADAAPLSENDEYDRMYYDRNDNDNIYRDEIINKIGNTVITAYPDKILEELENIRAEYYEEYDKSYDTDSETYAEVMENFGYWAIELYNKMRGYDSIDDDVAIDIAGQVGWDLENWADIHNLENKGQSGGWRRTN